MYSVCTSRHNNAYVELREAVAPLHVLDAQAHLAEGIGLVLWVW